MRAALANKRESIGVAMIHVHPVQCRYDQRTALRQLDVGNICLAQHARPMGRITVAFHLLGLTVILEQPPIGTYPQPVAVRLHTGYPPVFRIRLQAVGQRRGLKPMFSFLLQHTNPIVQSGTNCLSDAFYSSHWRLAKLFQTIISTDIPFLSNSMHHTLLLQEIHMSPDSSL